MRCFGFCNAREMTRGARWSAKTVSGNAHSRFLSLNADCWRCVRLCQKRSRRSIKAARTSWAVALPDQQRRIGWSTACVSRSWNARWCACHRVRREDADDMQVAGLALRTAVQVSTCDALPEVRQRFGFRARSRHDWAVERDTCLRQLALFGAIGAESVMTDAHEAAGQDMQQKAPQPRCRRR